MKKNKFIACAGMVIQVQIAMANGMEGIQAHHDLQPFYTSPSIPLNPSLSNLTQPNLLSKLPMMTSEPTMRSSSAKLFDGQFGYGQFFKQDTYVGAKTSVQYTSIESLTQAKLALPNSNIIGSHLNNSPVILKPVYNINAILGYKILPNILPFVEGGVSFADIKTNPLQNNIGSNLNGTISHNVTLNSQAYTTGYNLGLGANYQMSKNWFLSSELIYNYLGKQSAANTITLPSDANQTNSSTSTSNRSFQMISMLASVSYLLPVL